MSQSEVRLATYDAIHQALHHPELSRGLDRRSFEEGNARAGILSLLHGDEHQHRRRLESRLFDRRALVTYERELFPRVLSGVLDRAALGRVDLFELGGMLSVVLAARRAGIDHDGTLEELGRLFGHVKVIAQAAAVHDIVGDRDRVQAEAAHVLRELDKGYVLPARRRREQMLDRAADGSTGEGAVSEDLMTVALRGLREGDATFADHDLLVREVALFLHGGSHTSAQTLCNAFYYLLGLDGPGPRTDWLRRVAQSPLDAQRCVHETVRLRPTNPEMKRVAGADVDVAGAQIPVGTTVVLDARTANREPDLFGTHPERFDPDRDVRDDVPLWGFSFGSGAHICIGRSVAGGFPLTGAKLRGGVSPAHLYGLVALTVRAVAARGVLLDPDSMPELDERTTRGTRWSRFPVVLPARSGQVNDLAHRPSG
ncbi:MAG: cytochrome P450 [Nocardioidaceae bacterium]